MRSVSLRSLHWLRHWSKCQFKEDTPENERALDNQTVKDLSRGALDR